MGGRSKGEEVRSIGVCVYIYIHIYVCIYTHIYTYIHTYTYTHTHTYIGIGMYVFCLHACLCITHAFLVPADSRRGHWFLRNWSYRLL